MPYVSIPKVHEYVVHPWGQGALAVNGIQYGAIVNAATTNTYVTLTAAPFNVFTGTTPFSRGKIREVEFGLTAAFEANATCLLTYKWSARNLDPVTATWVDIKADEVVNAMTTAWQDQTVAGYALSQNDFNSVPFEVRCQFRTNHATLGIGKIKNSSYVRVLYEML